MMKSPIRVVAVALLTLAACSDIPNVVAGAPGPLTNEAAASTPAPLSAQGSGTPLGTAQLKANGTLALQVGGQAGVPTNASAVVMNVTVTNPTAAGFVTVWPCGAPRPLASNLNYVPGQNVPNLTISRLGTSGQVCFYSMVATDLVSDVAGFFPAGSNYKPIDNPTRILDTRNGTGAPAAKLGANAVLPLQVGGQASVPADAAAVVMNVTVTDPAAAGFVTVFPCGSPRPLASNLNYVAGQNVPDLTISRLGTGGQVCLYSMMPTDLVADVAGYIPAGSDYSPIDNPTRILDTRTGTGAPVAKVSANGTLQLHVGGQAGVPTDATAAVMNVTATNPAAAGFVTVWPCGAPRPLASNLNYVAGQNVPNLTISRLGTGGQVCFFSMVATDLVADVSGFFPKGSSYQPIDNPTRILDTRDGTGSAISSGDLTPPDNGGSSGGGGNGGGGGPGAAGGGAPPVDGVTPGASTCQLRLADASMAFCETFDSPQGNGGRSGDLDPELWGVSRLGFDNGGAGDFDTVAATEVVGCGDDGTQVLPPSDVRICNGRMTEAVNDAGGVVSHATYPKQPFDFNGRTGTVAFDVTADSDGTHGAWPEFWITEKPVPDNMAEISDQVPSIGQNAIGFALDGCNSATTTGVGGVFLSQDYAFSEPSFTTPNCITKPTGYPGTRAMNHIEVRISTSRMEVWGTDAGGTLLKQLAVVPNLNLNFSKGLVWLTDTHYNAKKAVEPCECGTQARHTFQWDNLGFDGPKTYRDLSFDVHDSHSAHGQVCDGACFDATNVGYGIGSTPVALNTDPVFQRQNPTAAIVTFNSYSYDAVLPSVSVNGNAYIANPWPYKDSPPFQNGAGGFSRRSYWMSVPLDQVHIGQPGAGAVNTLSFVTSGGGAWVANINLILVAGAPVP
jgi:hypothetical protein